MVSSGRKQQQWVGESRAEVHCRLPALPQEEGDGSLFRQGDDGCDLQRGKSEFRGVNQPGMFQSGAQSADP